MVTTGARGCKFAGSSGSIEHALFDVGFGDAPHGVTELFGDELSGVGVDRIGDLRHVTLLHEDADHVDAALGHAVGQFLNRDRLGDRHFAGDLFLRLVAMAGHALHAAAERSDRTFAYLVGGKGSHDGEAAAALFGAAARRFGRRCGPRSGAARAAADRARSFVFVGFERGTRPGLDRRDIGAEALLGDFVGLSAGLFLVLAALFFAELARFGGGALGAIDFFAASTNAGFFLGALALLVFPQLCAGERMGARIALVIGQRAQHDSGCFRRGSSRSARSRRGGRGFAGRSGRGGRTPRRGSAIRRGGGLRLGFARADTAFDLLDDDRLAAAVAETLAHHALLDAAALERQRLGRGDA